MAVPTLEDVDGNGALEIVVSLEDGEDPMRSSSPCLPRRPTAFHDRQVVAMFSVKGWFLTAFPAR